MQHVHHLPSTGHQAKKTLTNIVDAYNAFVVQHHPDVKAPEKMTKDSLTVAGFIVDKDVNTCKACGKSGGRQCCDAYDRDGRTRCYALRGAVLVRCIR